MKCSEEYVYDISWQSELVRPWLVPIIQGYVHIAELPVTFDDDDDLDPMTSTSDNGRVLNDLKFKLCLISRRSRYRAGKDDDHFHSSELHYLHLLNAASWKELN